MIDGMKIAVVGPGAIGATVAACLHAGGHPVTLCGRTARDNVEVRPDGQDSIVVPGPVHTDPPDVDGPYDLVFLAVKGTQVADAAGWLAALCGPNTVVCVLQNGVEQREMVGPLAAPAHVLPAVVWFPAETQPDGWVWLRARPRLTLPDGDDARVVRDVLDGPSCAVELSGDFTSEAWRKLLQNAAAGLLVLTGRRSGMYGREDIAALTEAYLRECLAVARAEGAELPDTTPAQVVKTFRDFPPDMGSSILADRVAQRPLEWDLRNGIIVRRGRKHGIATPISDVLVPLLAAASDGPG
jgi:2-dehydropantoate 2-reductase